MTETDNITENQTSMATQGVFNSPRNQFPKSKEDRRTVEKLIIQCYECAHTETHEILWSVVETQNPALYDQILYWCADKFSRIYSVTNNLRSRNELPKNLRPVGNAHTLKRRLQREAHDEPVRRNGIHPTKNGGARERGTNDKRFAGIDKWLLTKHKSFPKQAGSDRVAWSDVFDRFPAKEQEAMEIWGKDNRNDLRNILGGRLRQLLRQNGQDKAQTNGHPEQTHEPKEQKLQRISGDQEGEVKKLVAEIIRLGYRPDGSVSVAAVKKSHPELWDKILEHYSEEKAVKSIIQRIGYLRRKNQLAQIATGTALTKHETFVQPKTEQARPAIAPAEFHFVCCPMCRQDIRSVEETINARISNCARCQFPIEKLEQAYVALITIQPQL